MPRSLSLKKLDATSWLKADVPFSDSLTAERWVSLVTKPQPSALVPLDIVELYEVARGSVLYGWFFQPLLSLGSEQLLRVMEAAVRERCTLAGIALKKAPSHRVDRTYAELIDSLIEIHIIPDKERERWLGFRKLRNAASHPSKLTVLTPVESVSMLVLSVKRINALFAARNPDGIYYPPNPRWGSKQPNRATS